MANAEDLFDDLDLINWIVRVPRVYREITNPSDILMDRKFIKTFQLTKAGAWNLIIILILLIYSPIVIYVSIDCVIKLKRLSQHNEI